MFSETSSRFLADWSFCLGTLSEVSLSARSKKSPGSASSPPPEDGGGGGVEAELACITIRARRDGLVKDLTRKGTDGEGCRTCGEGMRGASAATKAAKAGIGEVCATGQVGGNVRGAMGQRGRMSTDAGSAKSLVNCESTSCGDSGWNLEGENKATVTGGSSVWTRFARRGVRLLIARCEEADAEVSRLASKSERLKIAVYFQSRLTDDSDAQIC